MNIAVADMAKRHQPGARHGVAHGTKYLFEKDREYPQWGR